MNFLLSSCLLLGYSCIGSSRQVQSQRKHDMFDSAGHIHLQKQNGLSNLASLLLEVQTVPRQKTTKDTPSKWAQLENREELMKILCEKKIVLTGVVSKWNNQRGFGYIDFKGMKVFAHQSKILMDGIRQLLEDETVEFMMGQDENGRFQAVDITGPDYGELVSQKTRGKGLLAEGTRASGRIVKFTPGRGFGFIKPSSGGKDIWFHETRFQEKVPIYEGQNVDFIVTHTGKGIEAADIAAPDDGEVALEKTQGKIYDEGEKTSGHVAQYNADRGFGFIRPKDGGKDIWFHLRDVLPDEITGLQDMPYRDQKVDFSIAYSRKGIEARNVAASLDTGAK